MAGPTSDFDFLDRFVALVVDFDFDWDGFTVEVELLSKPGDNQLMSENGGMVRITVSGSINNYLR